jgi:hypothetical protein
MAPISNPRIQEVEKSSTAAAPTIAAVAITPTVARARDGHSARRMAPGSVRRQESDQFAAYQLAHARASGRFPREGRKSRRRRRDKRADRPFAKIKKLFTKITRLI